MPKLDIVTGVQKSNDYPYGRLRCEITFQLEFKPNKGYRYVTQTKNPKTGRINKPKASTYSHFMAMYKNEEGHVKPQSFNFFGYDDIEKVIDFITENEITFTNEQSQELYATVIGCIRGNARYTQLADDVTVGDFLDATKVKQMIGLYGKNKDFNEIKSIGYKVEEFKTLIKR